MRIAGMFLVASLSFTVPVWGQFTKQDLLPSSRNAGASFGSDVALSADGTVALVGAPGEQAAYIFRLGPGGWSQEARLVPGVPAQEDFGLAVALSGDGKVALVGAPRAGGVFIQAGAAYAFGFNGGTWQQEAVLREPFPAAINRVGFSVALSSDGSVGLVGAPYDYCEGHCGSVFSFTRTAGVWSFETEIRPADDLRGGFGFAMSLSPDGSTALISAPFDNCSVGADCGAAYLYQHGPGTWTLLARLTASDPNAVDLFGATVALSLESGTAVIGTPYRRCAGQFNCGAVYIFEGSGTTWTERQKFIWDKPGDWFGNGLALSEDGSSLLIKAPLADCNGGGADCGEVYRSVLIGGQWTALRPIATFPPNSFNVDLDGLALSADGSRGLVGAPQTPCEQGASCGIAYVFSLAAASVEVPALNGLGLALLAILLAGSGAALLLRRRMA